MRAHTHTHTHTNVCFSHLCVWTTWHACDPIFFTGCHPAISCWSWSLKVHHTTAADSGGKPSVCHCCPPEGTDCEQVLGGSNTTWLWLWYVVCVCVFHVCVWHWLRLFWLSCITSIEQNSRSSIEVMQESKTYHLLIGYSYNCNQSTNDKFCILHMMLTEVRQ